MANVWHYKRGIERGLSHYYVNVPATEEKEGECMRGSLRHEGDQQQ